MGDIKDDPDNTNRDAQQQTFPVNFEQNCEKEQEETSLISDLALSRLQNVNNNLLNKISQDVLYRDVTLHCGDKEQLSVHSLVLASASDYLKEILLKDYNNDVEKPVVEHLLSYIYTGKVLINSDEMRKLMDLFGLLCVRKKFIIEDGSAFVKHEHLELDPDIFNPNYNDFINNSEILSTVEYNISDSENIMEKTTPVKRKASGMGRRGRPKKSKTGEKADMSRKSCDICGQHFADSRAVRLHKERGHGSDNEKKTVYLRGKTIPLSELEATLPYQCKCLKRFETEVSLQNHKKYICPDCGRCLGWKANYDKHMIRHGAKDAYKCIQCGAGFGTEKLVVLHEKTFHGNQFKCEPCNKIYETRKKLREHQKRTHEQSHVCSFCNRRFPLPGALRLHIEESHGNLPQLPCPHCQKIFNGENRLQRHIQAQHIEPKVLCAFCGQAFRFQSGLDDHITRTHSGFRKYKCTDCNAAFHAEKTLKTHIFRIHRNEYPFQCTQCGKRFKLGGDLKGHLASHSEEKPFKCPYDCSSTFKHKKSMKNHIDFVHKGNIKFSCIECGKGFIDKTSQKQHERGHSGIKPFSCEFCSSKYTRRTHLNDHKRKHHFEQIQVDEQKPIKFTLQT